MRMRPPATAVRQVLMVVALVACGGFALAATPTPLDGQCTIVPKCAWCSCEWNGNGELVCTCHECTLGCEEIQ